MQTCSSGWRGDLEEFGTVEQMPQMEGRQMVMVIASEEKLVSRHWREDKTGKAAVMCGSPATTQ